MAYSCSPFLSTISSHSVTNRTSSTAMGDELAKKPRKHVEYYDTGPIERAQHNKVAIERDVNNRPRLRVLDQLEIDRLLLQRKITMDQHTAGEHLYRLITSVGYFPAAKWALDSSIRGDTQSISHHRAMALAKIGLARAWLHAKAGHRTTAYLFSVLLEEAGTVPDKLLPSFCLGLASFQAFEGWWHNQDHTASIPDLLAEMPRNIQAHKPRSFHHEV